MTAISRHSLGAEGSVYLLPNEEYLPSVRRFRHWLTLGHTSCHPWAENCSAQSLRTFLMLGGENAGASHVEVLGRAQSDSSSAADVPCNYGACPGASECRYPQSARESECSVPELP